MIMEIFKASMNEGIFQIIHWINLKSKAQNIMIFEYVHNYIKKQ